MCTIMLLVGVDFKPAEIFAAYPNIQALCLNGPQRGYVVGSL